MLLVDVDYDEEIFNMDRTVFAKDISADGEIRMAGLTVWTKGRGLNLGISLV